MRRFGLDIETKCAAPGCTDKHCDHALHAHTNRITLISIWSPAFHKTFRSAAELREYWGAEGPFEVVTHYGTFDLSVLNYHGCPIPLEYWAFDTQFASTVSLTKVSDEYLEQYAAERDARNKALPRGYSHRAGSPNSLKVLAPYFLGVPAFWEDPTNHDNVEYNLRDTEYTYRLSEFFEDRLREEGTYEFFTRYMMRWARQLLRMSLRGVDVDLEGLKAAEADSLKKRAEYKARLDEMWAGAYDRYLMEERAALHAKYEELALAQIAKGRDPEKTRARYGALWEKAVAKIEPLNLSSPDQLAWLLRDYFGLDIRDIDDEDSTGKEVLQRLVAEGRGDIGVFLKYRAEDKLLRSFYPTVWELQRNGKLHAGYNVGGARSGRASSSNPNMQNQPPRIRQLIVAPPGKLLADFDAASIEPHILAYYSECPVLCGLLIRGDDFHGTSAIALFDLDCHPNDVKKLYPRERKVAKELGLATLYGAGAKRMQVVAMKHGFSWDLETCKRKINALRNAYPGARDFKRALDQMAQQKPVIGFFGKKYLHTDDKIYLNAVNHLIQGTAAQIVLESCCRIDEWFQAEGIDGEVLLTVHDSIVTAVPEGNKRAIELIEQAMCSWDLPTSHGSIQLKVEGKVGRTWQ